jgi:hypothetical protein
MVLSGSLLGHRLTVQDSTPCAKVRHGSIG